MHNTSIEKRLFELFKVGIKTKGKNRKKFRLSTKNKFFILIIKKGRVS